MRTFVSVSAMASAMRTSNGPARTLLGVCAAAAVLTACSSAGSPRGFGAPTIASNPEASVSTHLSTFGVHYRLITLPPLSGDGSHANSINDRGWIAGDSTIRQSSESNAALWIDSHAIDVGTLGGASCVCWPVKTNRSELAATSQTKQSDPLGEDFCSSVWSTSLVCRGFRWRGGTIKLLPTLGGNNDQAAGENDKGQIVGVAETARRDRGCALPQVLHYNATIWQADGKAVALRPFSGDAVSQAIAINNRGDVVGASGACGPPYVPGYGSTHALIWRNGLPADLGNLGGTTVNAAFAINDRGDIAGASTLSDNITIHAFFWRRGVMTDLGTLAGDVESIALGLNNDGSVVGISCDASGNCRGFVWKDQSMSDLNHVVAHAPSQFIINGQDINDRGWIVGQVYNGQSGQSVAYVAVPHDNDASHFYAQDVARTILPETFRIQVVRRTTFRPYLNQ
ncbi:MAG: hypothetical protein JO322_12765 [Candidatus Eremiobacteraeota bacterium]|nr:hypothetical protein [Candidatus Eremiobacteraeota bacterium]